MLQNTRLAALVKFSHRVTVYVPGTDGVNTAADTTAWVEKTARALSTMFGGATSTAARGYWIANSGETVREDTTMVFAYAKEADLQEHADSLMDFITEMKQELRQEAVALEINGEMYFI